MALDFLQVMLQLSETEHFLAVRAFFEAPIQKCPEVLLLGLAQLEPKAGAALLDELLSQLFPLFLLNHANSIQILEALWKVNQSLFIAAVSEVFKKETSSLNLSRVLDITQEIRDSLLPIANCDDYDFSVG